MIHTSFSFLLNVLCVQLDFKSQEVTHRLVCFVPQNLVDVAKSICDMNPPVNTINTKYTPRVLGTIKYLTPDSQGEMRAGIWKVEGVWDGTTPSASLAWSRESWVTEARVLMGLFPCPGPHLHLSLTGAHSLCFNFTIKSWSRPGQPWCEAQVFMNKNLFLQYDSDSNMVKPLGLLGKKVNATSTWGELTQTLGEVSRDLRMLLLDIKPQIKTSGKCGMGWGNGGRQQEMGGKSTGGEGL